MASLTIISQSVTILVARSPVCSYHLRPTSGLTDFPPIPVNWFMHRLSSHYLLKRFRIASLFLVITFLSLPVAIGFLSYGLLEKDAGWMQVAGYVLAAGLVLKVLSHMVGGRLKCPLCMGTPLRNLGCSKHKSAQTLFGSHKLDVAVSILFQDKFRCPYCGETTGMQVRERRVRRY